MSEYLSFLPAERVLSQRLGATREEIAAWIYMTPEPRQRENALVPVSIRRLLHYSPLKAKHAPAPVSLPAFRYWPALPLPGIAAYTNANEFDTPPRFHFDDLMGDDYLKPLMTCWFKTLDITSFRPQDRYITGAQLVERWTPFVGGDVDAFIRAKITESSMLDFHPTKGGTQWSELDAPPKESALFVLGQVEAIEAEIGIELPVGEIEAPPATEQAQQHPAATEAPPATEQAMSEGHDWSAGTEPRRRLDNLGRAVIDALNHLPPAPTVQQVFDYLVNKDETGYIRRRDGDELTWENGRGDLSHTSKKSLANRLPRLIREQKAAR